MKYLNLGCGSHFHLDWTNVDFVSNNEHVISYDLLNGIPFSDDIFDVVYHSHILEHFSRQDGEKFMAECFRVLKRGGIIRLAVPDLEKFAIGYIDNLKKVTDHFNEINEADYDWSMIELYDQTVRTFSGGEMGKYWQQEYISNEDYVKERMGFEYINYRKEILARQLVQLKINSTIHKPKHRLVDVLRTSYWRLKLLHFLLSEENLKDQFEIARFRRKGEIHQWMYDRFSLKRLLVRTGFQKVTLTNAFTSNIEEWGKYNFLDIQDNQVRKPDSLFMEGFK